MLTIVSRLSLLLVLAASALVFGARPLALAQDASPEAGADADTEMMEEGVSFVPIGFADGVELPSTASLIAVKFTIEPGAILPLEEDDPTGGFLLVESGAFTVTIGEEWAVTRSGGEMGPAEMIAAEAEGTLAAGDSAYIPGSVTGEIRNDGAEPAVGTVVLIAPGSLSEMGEEEASPAP